METADTCVKQSFKCFPGRLKTWKIREHGKSLWVNIYLVWWSSRPWKYRDRKCEGINHNFLTTGSVLKITPEAQGSSHCTVRTVSDDKLSTLEKLTSEYCFCSDTFRNPKLLYSAKTIALKKIKCFSLTFIFLFMPFWT